MDYIEVKTPVLDLTYHQVLQYKNLHIGEEPRKSEVARKGNDLQFHAINRVQKRRDSTRAGILGALAYVSIGISTMMSSNKESQPALQGEVEPSIMQMYGSVEYNEFLEGERREQERLLAIEEAEQLSTFRSILPTDGYAHVSQ